ncbi:DegV family protein [Liberiplasma polymorphum]|uniref:DegV family protein n=1 Tax=Liberiplasma polymorphum TaxID=3374570 RepID=UPI00377128E4
MKKTAVIAISTGCLDYLELKKDNLFMVRCKILMNDKQYDDFTGIDADTFYSALKKDPDLVPTSSMPSVGEVLKVYEQVEAAGYEDVLVITISKGLSGTFESCLMAKNAYPGNLNIWVIHTKNAAISEGYITLEALRLIDEGVDFESIKTYIKSLSLARKQYFLVDNLRLLVKNGRLSGVQGFLGGLLKIKPILQVNDEGKIVPFEKIRTKQKALDRMVEVVLEDLKNINDFVVTYNTSDNIDSYNYIKSKIDEVYPNHQHYSAPITPVIGCHTGHGTVGIAYFNLDLMKK